MITQKDKEELAIFLPIVVAVTVAIGSVTLLAHFVGELHALYGIVAGLVAGFVLLNRQVAKLERELRKYRGADDHEQKTV
jgi:hypothetical protein